MKKLIERIKKLRLVGYVVISVGMYKAGVSIETIVPEMFLMVILVELSSKKGKKIDLSTTEGQKTAKNLVK